MSNRTLNLTEPAYEYLLANSLREPDILQQLREETLKLEMGLMQISPEQGQFFSLLVKLLDIKNIIEVGVFTGYSSLALALALPDDGHIVACDINEEWTNVAKQYWQRAGVTEKIELHLGHAIDTLNGLLEHGQAGQYDFAFIDADKTSYKDYYEACLKLIRPGGLIIIDNVLWGGSVADPEDQTEDTRAIRELNAFIHKDPRVDMSLLPVGDGLSLVRRKD